MADGPDTITDLTMLLSSSDEDFIVLGELLPERGHIRFIGNYHGQPVFWNAQVLALLFDHPANAPPAQFIDIGPARGALVDISIGLAVQQIDVPTLRKAVIMVRNYRRLRPGRHEFHG